MDNLTIIFILTIFGILSVSFFLWLRVSRRYVEATIFKTFASLLFVATGSIAWHAGGAGFWGTFILLGLVFGLTGDVFLDLKVAYSADSEKWTSAGMAAFAFGHVLYLTGVFIDAGSFLAKPVSWLAIPVLLAAGFTAGVWVVAPKMQLHYGKFLIPSLSYAFLLSFFVLVCGKLFIQTHFAWRWGLLLFGAFLFLVSDLILSLQYFGPKQHENNRIWIITNHATYYMAQFSIAISMVFAE